MRVICNYTCCVHLELIRNKSTDSFVSFVYSRHSTLLNTLPLDFLLRGVATSLALNSSHQSSSLKQSSHQFIPQDDEIVTCMGSHLWAQHSVLTLKNHHPSAFISSIHFLSKKWRQHKVSTNKVVRLESSDVLIDYQMMNITKCDIVSLTF